MVLRASLPRFNPEKLPIWQPIIFIVLYPGYVLHKFTSNYSPSPGGRGIGGIKIYFYNGFLPQPCPPIKGRE
jgi:hypothetical protein